MNLFQFENMFLLYLIWELIKDISLVGTAAYIMERWFIECPKTDTCEAVQTYTYKMMFFIILSNDQVMVFLSGKIKTLGYIISC